MIEIVEFQEACLRPMADIFRHNYKNLRQEIPSLPEEYSDAAKIRNLLAEIVVRNPCLVAVESDLVIGYLTGYGGIPSFKGSGPGVYVPEWAHGVIDDTRYGEIYNTLYRHMARLWLASGCHTHCISVFAAQTNVLRRFNELCFGKLVIDGVRPIKPTAAPVVSARIEGCREAGDEDLKALAEFYFRINEHLNDSPIYLNRSTARPAEDKLRESFFSMGRRTVVVEDSGQLYGAMSGELGGGNCDTAQSPSTLAIDFAWIRPERRRGGAAESMLHSLLQWGLDQEMTRCTVDFETMNLEAIQFWCRFFKPFVVSLMRKVDDRISG
jgi:Acetyltransferase (GNAT) family